MNRFSAFTLAEVLLTLSIIGVVAAMTIPTLIAKQQNDTYVAGMKKIYSVLSAATDKVKDDCGGDYSALFAPTDATQGNVALEAFAPHLNITKNCGAGTGCLPDKLYYLYGGEYEWESDDDGRFGKAILSDGMIVEIISDDSSCTGGISDFCAQIIVDVNGHRGPNTFGRDIYEFDLYKTKLVPCGFDESAATVNVNCSEDGSGHDCAARILREGAMNY